MYFKMSILLLMMSATLVAQSVGLASWYGKKFQGKPTASGEPFNMYAYTAAHRTLPFGTIVTVTNLKNNKSVNVKINDRGPHKPDRIIDISYQAAQSIGLVRLGTTMVGINTKGSKQAVTPVVSPSKLLVTPASKRDMVSMMEYALMVTDPNKSRKKVITPSVKKVVNQNIRIQVASFSTKIGAEQFIQKMKGRGEKMAIVPVFLSKIQQTRYKVVILTDSKEKALAIVKSKQYDGAYILK